MCARLGHWWRLYLPEQTNFNVLVSIAYLSDNGAYVGAVRRQLLVCRKGQHRKAGGRSECTYEYVGLYNTSKVFDWHIAKGCRLPQRTCRSRINYVPGSPPVIGDWTNRAVFVRYPARSIERLGDHVLIYLPRAQPRKPSWIYINGIRPRAVHQILQGKDQHVTFSRCV